jgi:hypothetical protein
MIRPEHQKGYNQNMDIYIRDHCLHVSHMHTRDKGALTYVSLNVYRFSGMYRSVCIEMHMCLSVYACNRVIRLFTYMNVYL